MAKANLILLLVLGLQSSPAPSLPTEPASADSVKSLEAVVEKSDVEEDEDTIDRSWKFLDDRANKLSELFQETNDDRPASARLRAVFAETSDMVQECNQDVIDGAARKTADLAKIGSSATDVAQRLCDNVAGVDGRAMCQAFAAPSESTATAATAATTATAATAATTATATPPAAVPVATAANVGGSGGGGSASSSSSSAAQAAALLQSMAFARAVRRRTADPGTKWAMLQPASAVLHRLAGTSNTTRPMASGLIMVIEELDGTWDRLITHLGTANPAVAAAVSDASDRLASVTSDVSQQCAGATVQPSVVVEGVRRIIQESTAILQTLFQAKGSAIDSGTSRSLPSACPPSQACDPVYLFQYGLVPPLVVVAVILVVATPSRNVMLSCPSYYSCC